MKIFEKKYDSESLYDLDRDISEAISEDYNPKMSRLPQDEHGFHKGTFTVSIVWNEESVDES